MSEDLKKINSINPIESKTAFYMEAKERVQGVIDGFKQLEQHCKKTKQSRKAMKLMEDFVKCNITSDAIGRKYQAVANMLLHYYNKGIAGVQKPVGESDVNHS